MQPFLAMIMPVGGGGPVDPGYNPPGVGGPGSRPPSPGVPTHPIYTPPQPPLGIWGGPWQPPYVDAGLPPFATQLPTIPPGGAWPSGGRPVDPGYGVDIGTGPVHPAHPIYIPAPPTEPPSPPLQIWGGPYFPPEPTHPIELPPEVAPPETPDGRPIEWKVAWTPTTGWIVVGIPTGPVPTPSKKAAP